MLMARSRPPTTCTSPTPPMRSSCGRTILSPSSVSSRNDRFAESASVSTGVLSLSNFCTTGGVASSGNCRPRVFTRSRTACAADSRLRSSLNVAITIAVPCPDTERSSLMPSTVFTISSIGCATSESTSSGAAPGRVTRTETVGRSTEGKRSTPSLKKPAAPTTTSDNTIMVAKTGRRMQISANFCMEKFNRSYLAIGPILENLVNYFDSLPRLQVARIDDHFFTDIDSVYDLSEISGAATGRDRFLERLSVLHHEHFLNAGKRDDRVVWHRHRHLRVVCDDLGVRK